MTELEPKLKTYKPIELLRLQQLHNLTLDIRRYERLMARTNGRPLTFEIPNHEGTKIRFTVSPNLIVALYEVRKGIYEDCELLGDKDEADMMIKTSLDTDKIFDTKIPEAFTK